MNQTDLCSLPWVELHITPTGKFKNCCAQLGQLSSVSEKSLGLNQIFNSSAFSQVRQEFLNGKPPASCADCLQLAKIGTGYKSIKSHQWRTQAQRSLALQENLPIKFLDIRFSHLCNFACRTCDSENSSRWQNLDAMVGRSAKTSPNAQSARITVEDILPVTDQLEEIYFAGGEPLIIKDHYVLLEELIRRQKTNLTLSYNTNLSVKNMFGKDLLDLWSRFDKVLLYPSIDAIGEQGEYIREGLNWSEFEKNFQLFRPYIQGLNAVLSAYNIFSIQNLLRWVVDKNMDLSISPAFLPNEITVDVLPPQMLLIAAIELEQLMKATPFSTTNVMQIRSSIEFLRAPKKPGNPLHFLEFNKKLDEPFSKKYADVFPREYGLINQNLQRGLHV